MHSQMIEHLCVLMRSDIFLNRLGNHSMNGFKQKRIMIKFAFFISLQLPCIGCIRKKQDGKQGGELRVCSNDLYRGNGWLDQEVTCIGLSESTEPHN